MSDTRRNERHAAIVAAAYDLLAEKGYAATSMLAIARRARASNETLYRWYGNKQGLFRRMVEDNAAAAREILTNALDTDADTAETFQAFGPALLRLVTGERAVALNRTAAADLHDTGSLGQTIAAAGRDTVLPLLSGLIGQALERGVLAGAPSPEIAETYVSLLIGDMQIRRAIGVLPEPDAGSIQARSERAFRQLQQLYPA